MEKYFLGVNTPVFLYSCANLCSILGETAVVCVLSKFFGFCFAPIVPPTSRPSSAFLVHGLDVLEIVMWQVLCLSRLLYEEGVVGISGRMLLRLEESVEVPEGRLH